VNDFRLGDGEEVRLAGDARDDPEQGAGARSHGIPACTREPVYATPGQIARHALEFYSKLWAPYAFPQLTLQDGPSAGHGIPDGDQLQPAARRTTRRVTSGGR
jgi:hypothetical protein